MLSFRGFYLRAPNHYNVVNSGIGSLDCFGIHLDAGRGFRTPDLQIMSDAFIVEAGALTRLSFRLDIPAPSRRYEMLLKII